MSHFVLLAVFPCRTALIHRSQHRLLMMLSRAGRMPSQKELAQKLDVAEIRHRRRENAAVLLEAFSDIALFPALREEDCPLFVPILVPDGKRDELRRYLIQNAIYCPVHWPLTDDHIADPQTLQIYQNGLSLLCDQRYGAADMARIVETVKTFWKD